MSIYESFWSLLKQASYVYGLKPVYLLNSFKDDYSKKNTKNVFLILSIIQQGGKKRKKSKSFDGRTKKEGEDENSTVLR